MLLTTLIDYKRLFALLDSEIYLALWLLFLMAWLFHRFFLKELSEERHLNLKMHYNKIKNHLFILTLFFITYYLLHENNSQEIKDFFRTTIVFAIMSYIWGIIVLVKILRTLALQYLFLGSMKAGVPRLIVNIFSLSLYITFTAWSLNYFLGIHLTPILATSAAVSIILGLALQDTLGNLFAGISLQIDKGFEMDDWVEIMVNGQKVVGQVREMTWRATILLGFSGELINIPNRILSQSQVSNFSTGKAIDRRLIFRFDHGHDMHKIKMIINEALLGATDILIDPDPVTNIFDITESWIEARVFYKIRDYGQQYAIADKVYSRVVDVLRQNDIRLAQSKLQVIQ